MPDLEMASMKTAIFPEEKNGAQQQPLKNSLISSKSSLALGPIQGCVVLLHSPTARAKIRAIARLNGSREPVRCAEFQRHCVVGLQEETDPVRIIIAGPPKAGNVWLKCILGHIYDLRPLTNRETPNRPQFQLFKDWVEAGGFPDGTVFHQHYDYTNEL